MEVSDTHEHARSRLQIATARRPWGAHV